jgi:hypothetical protein
MRAEPPLPNTRRPVCRIGAGVCAFLWATAAAALDPAPRAVGTPAGGEELRARAVESESTYDGPYLAPSRRRRDAREGYLFSLGIGGAQNYLSGTGHAAGIALSVRMGYGFSDRFQLFFDLSALPANYGFGQQATSWTGSVRGQTVLLGDRQGNGLNLNLGVGLGGLDTSSAGAPFASSRVGLALAGGLSADMRISPWFALSPELTAQWHRVPNDYGFPSDIHRAFGGQLNFVWYSP